MTVHDNYFAGASLAPGGARGGPDDSSAKTSFVHNVNMDTGAVVQDTNATTPPGDTVAPAKPVIASFSPDTGTVGDGLTTAQVLTLSGTAEATSTVELYDGTTPLGSVMATGSGGWSYTTGTLSSTTHSFTATATDAAGNTSVASAALNVTVDAPSSPPPPSSSTNLVVNGGFETSDFAGWTTSGNVAQLSIGPQLFIASGAHSGQSAAGFGSMGSDGTISQNLTTVVGESYTLDFWLANLASGPNDFTAKIGGVTELHLVNATAQPYTHYDFTFTATSTNTVLEFDFRQDPLEWHLDDVSVVATGSAPPSSPSTPPAVPDIVSFSPDTTPVGDGHTTATSITLTGTGEANSTVNVSAGTSSIGHASVNASGAWSLQASGLTVGLHNFTATDTDADGTSTASAVFAVTVDAPTTLPSSPSPTNLVVNGGFETGDFTGWTLTGNFRPLSYGPQTFISDDAKDGSAAAGLGSVGADGILSQNIQTTDEQHYTLDFWLANRGSGPNDFTVKWNDTVLLSRVNQPSQAYTEYTFDVIGTAGTSHLEFDARQDPSHWSLDSISVTPHTTHASDFLLV